MTIRSPQHPLAWAVGALALAVATTGTAVAATGTSMNVTDPVTAANKARVTAKGQLRVDPTAAQPVRGSSTLVRDRYTVLVPPTTATLALTDLIWAVYRSDPSAWTAQLYQVQAPTPEDCSNPGGWTSSRFLGQRTLQPAATLLESLSTPLVVGPLSPGATWCLVTYGDTASSGWVPVTWSGHVLAGSLRTTGSGGPQPVDGRPAGAAVVGTG